MGTPKTEVQLCQDPRGKKASATRGTSCENPKESLTSAEPGTSSLTDLRTDSASTAQVSSKSLSVGCISLKLESFQTSAVPTDTTGPTESTKGFTTDKISYGNSIQSVAYLRGKLQCLWQRIAGFDDYWISGLGAIISFREHKPKLLKTSAGGGYPHVRISRGRRGHGATHKHVVVHDLVASHFLGPKPHGMEVNHIDHDPCNNNFRNLEYVTSRNNTLHSVKAGRWPIGSRRWNSVLSETQVSALKVLLAEGVAVKKLAKLLGVSEPALHHIKAGRAWKHVTVP